MKFSKKQLEPEESRIFGGERIFMPHGRLTITNGKADVWYQYLGEASDLTDDDIGFMLDTAPQKIPRTIINLDDLTQWRRVNNINNPEPENTVRTMNEPIQPANHTDAVRKMIASQKFNNAELSKMVSLANMLAGEDGEDAVMETLYGYMSGLIKWQDDYEEFFSLPDTDF